MSKIIKNYNKLEYGPALEDNSEAYKWISTLSKPNHIFINGNLTT